MAAQAEHNPPTQWDKEHWSDYGIYLHRMFNF